MASYNPKHYVNYQELTELLTEYSKEFSQFCQLESIGQSRTGKELWLLTLTDQKTGHHLEKPGYWVSGNIHATELSGCQAALHVIHRVLDGVKNNDARFERILQNNSLYVVPRISPDGAEAALKGQVSRSVLELYPIEETPGFYPCDLDGDGVSRWMIIPDEGGNWKKSEKDDRALLIRKPHEYDPDTQYYRLYPEGRIEGEGQDTDWSRSKHNYDYNRNFPVNWEPEGQQLGAGEYPLVHPETMALAKAVLARENIVGAQDFHTFSSVILRPGFFETDEQMDELDLHIFKNLGEQGSQVTGYPCISVKEDFYYTKKRDITGGFLDWMYNQRGIFGFTNEIWSLFKEAGIEIKKDQHVKYLLNAINEDDQIKILNWCDNNCDSDFFKNWESFEHPDFGNVEIGGWNRVQPIGNPPENLLCRESENNSEFVLMCIESNPNIKIVDKSIEPLESNSGTHRVSVELQNQGYISSRGSQKTNYGKAIKDPFGLIEMSSELRLVTGHKRFNLNHLEGRSRIGPATTHMFVGGHSTKEQPTNRKKFEWVVQGKGVMDVTFNFVRGGNIKVQFEI